MEKFNYLTKKEINELEDILRIADDVIKSDCTIINNNNEYSEIIKQAMGGAIGSAIAGATIATTMVTLGKIGVAGIGATIALPATIAAIAGSTIGKKLLSNKKVGKEQQKQIKYVEKIVEKINQIITKYDELIKEKEEKSNEKDEVIKQLLEKIAEYELILKVLTKKYEDLKKNIEAL